MVQWKDKNNPSQFGSVVRAFAFGLKGHGFNPDQGPIFRLQAGSLANAGDNQSECLSH